MLAYGGRRDCSEHRFHFSLLNLNMPSDVFRGRGWGRVRGWGRCRGRSLRSCAWYSGVSLRNFSFLFALAALRLLWRGLRKFWEFIHVEIVLPHVRLPLPSGSFHACLLVLFLLRHFLRCEWVMSFMD